MLKEIFRRAVKIGPHSNENVILFLIKCKCMPLLLYGTESCPLTKADNQSLDNCNEVLMEIFKSSNRDFVLRRIS